MTSLTLFVATFLFVFAFGFVTRTGYLAAFLSTLAIGVAYLVVFRFVPMRSPLDVTAYLLGGPIGIVASIAARRWWIERSHRPAPRPQEPARGDPADMIYDDLAPWRRR